MRHYVQVMQRLAAMSSSTIANTAIEYREAMEETSNIEEGVLKQINQMVEAKVNCDSVQQIGHGEIVYVHREQATHINTDARAHTHGRTGARAHGRTDARMKNSMHARARMHARTPSHKPYQFVPPSLKHTMYPCPPVPHTSHYNHAR